MPLYTLILGLLFSQTAWSYPQFIGYKYSSCLTCHFNGQGNGPLNDYGRALFATELSSRKWAGKKTDEELGEASGFLGKKQLPWWVRPGFKARELFFQANPPEGDVRDILMQAEASVAMFFDKEQKLAFVGSFGYAPVPLRFQNSSEEKPDEWISREHYIRWQFKPNIWVYAGMMDKVYGIRINNHTAYSRSRTGMAQNDQSHGLVVHFIDPKWELSLNVFAGNMFQEYDLRQQGTSMLYEYELKEAWRVGFTALNSTNNFITYQRYGVLSRYGFGHGSALLFEMGIIDDAPKIAGSKKKGYYLYSEAMQKLVRGYHLFFVGQAYKDDMTTGRPDNVRLGAGLLFFPFTRTEFRVEVENTRQITDSAQAQPDSWAIMGQIHLSM